MAETIPGESGRVMPIMLSSDMRARIDRGAREVRVRDLPWELFDPAAERTSRENHGQSLAVIAERGGFNACEAIAVLTCVPFIRIASMSEIQAHRILYVMRALYRRGGLFARRDPNNAARVDGRGGSE